MSSTYPQDPSEFSQKYGESDKREEPDSSARQHRGDAPVHSPTNYGPPQSSQFAPPAPWQPMHMPQNNIPTMQYQQAHPHHQMYAQQPIVVNYGPQRRTNHLLHLVLTLLTAGLWIPVWIIVAITNSSK